MDLTTFQRKARKTSQLPLGGPQGSIAPMLGLASEAGSILDVYKRYLSDKLDRTSNREFLKEELGDLLWYVAAVATSENLDLGEIARVNLQRTRDRYLPTGTTAKLAVLDASFPKRERFPRRLVFEFREQRKGKRTNASVKLVSAKPNAFPNGPIKVADGKTTTEIGYRFRTVLGDPVNDNSRRQDGYRYHDAIHMAFMAVLGWSPVTRNLLRLKRKSNKDTDDFEDGARARYTEEGLAAVLASLAERRNAFQSDVSVDGDAIGVAKASTVGLEVKKMPSWLWRKAISQGFQAMRQLANNKGGYLIADLDARELRYRKSM